MSENLILTSERVDDLPLLLAQLEHMGVAELLDAHFPTHGNWEGLSLGGVTDVWLTFIVSEANHRLSHVEPWAAQRLGLLERCLGQPVRALDVSDDRLAAVLDQLSDDARWVAFECALNQRTLRVYDLPAAPVRIDSTTASSYTTVQVERLFQLGHSKDHRPDLPQVKINVSVLDPLGLPLTTTVVSGQQADDPLYIPEIRRVQQSIERRGITYIGDCKMGAQETRAFIAASADYYLCPLSSVQVPADVLTALLTPVWEGHQPVTVVTGPAAEDEAEPAPIATGYEYAVDLTAEVTGRSITWTERRLVVRSLAQARHQEHALRHRLTQAVAALAALNRRGQGKPRWREEAALRTVAEAIVAKYRVTGLVQLQYLPVTHHHPVRRYRDRPAGVRVEQDYQVTATVHEPTVQAAVARLGWRVYATNHLPVQLPLTQAVLAYRAEYLIERGIGRLKGKPLSLTPLYLTSEARVTGLIRLLMLALRVLTLLEFRVRRQLHNTGSGVRGLYPGQPGRLTIRPTAELLLRAFTGVTLTRIRDGDRERWHLTPLSPLQTQILQLVGFSSDIYRRLEPHSSKPVFNLSEP